MSKDLIFDIGLNHGEDSQFYLAKGFRVVGVEANPLLAEENRVCQSAYIDGGQFVVENVGIMDKPVEMPFYRNISNDHWSSFSADYGCRDGTEYEIIPVKCITILDLIEKHGCPYYMKIDVEGADKIILRDMVALSVLPQFISVEEFGAPTFDYLHALGYERFSIRPQADKSWSQMLTESKEGEFVATEFTHRDSGVFGRDISDWMTLQEAKQRFSETVRSPAGDWLPSPGEFFDIHAARDPAYLA